MCGQKKRWGWIWRFSRSIYRACRWPTAFRRDEAFDAVDPLIKKIGESD